MKQVLLILLTSFVTFNVAFAQENNYAEDEIIVKIKEVIPFTFEEGKTTFGFGNIDHINSQFEVASIERLIKSKPKRPMSNRPNMDKLLIVKYNHSINVEDMVKVYQASGFFEYAEPNYIGYGGGVQGYTPNDSYYHKQWQFKNDGTFNSSAVAGADMNMENAWDITTGDSSVVVAILDSGMKLNHPEIANRLWRNYADNNSDNVDDDNNGYKDDYQGWDFAYSDNTPDDAYGHGTNVGSIVGMEGDNGTGLAGVDWNCKLMIGKILNDNDFGYYSWWTDGIYYAVDNGADVINMSVGGSTFSATLEAAVNYAYANGVVVVVCMMNADNNSNYYPAAFTNSIAVGATGVDDKRVSPFFWSSTSGSNYGSHIDLVAPGSPIHGLSYNSNANYNSYWGGTSQASPQVAGVAALMKALDPNLSVDDIRNILKNTADDQVGDPSEDIVGWDQYYGAGRLNAGAALAYVQSLISSDDEVKIDVQVNISPNPASEFVQINTNGEKIDILSIYNINGQMIKQFNHLNSNQPIDIKNMTSGTYIFEMWLDGNRISKKVVVD